MIARTLRVESGGAFGSTLAALERRMPSGLILTMLRRDERSLFCVIDYSRIDAMGGDVVRLGGERNGDVR
jgi:hypothetical protein